MPVVDGAETPLAAVDSATFPGSAGSSPAFSFKEFEILIYVDSNCVPGGGGSSGQNMDTYSLPKVRKRYSDILWWMKAYQKLGRSSLLSSSCDKD